MDFSPKKFVDFSQNRAVKKKCNKRLWLDCECARVMAQKAVVKMIHAIFLAFHHSSVVAWPFSTVINWAAMLFKDLESHVQSFAPAWTFCTVHVHLAEKLLFLSFFQSKPSHVRKN